MNEKTSVTSQHPTSLSPAEYNECLENMFNSHVVDGDGADAMNCIREYALKLADVITTFCPVESYEYKLAIRKTREAMFWANAAISSKYPILEPRNRM